jgi:hypothetical protein
MKTTIISLIVIWIITVITAVTEIQYLKQQNSNLKKKLEKVFIAP